jgi:hypothetical protein
LEELWTIQLNKLSQQLKCIREELSNIIGQYQLQERKKKWKKENLSSKADVWRRLLLTSPVDKNRHRLEQIVIKDWDSLGFYQLPRE